MREVEDQVVVFSTAEAGVRVEGAGVGGVVDCCGWVFIVRRRAGFSFGGAGFVLG